MEKEIHIPVEFKDSTEQTLATASTLREGLGLWQDRRKTKGNPEATSQFAEIQERTVSELLDQRVAILNPEIETFQKKLTKRFLSQVLKNSPLPPTGLSEFIDQVLISQKSKGDIPVVLQQIACLNYRHIPELKEEHVLPITDKTKRWKRFLDEERDFLIGLNEIGARPAVIFGVSDVLDFENEDTFADSPELLSQNVEQNREHMQADMQSLSNTFQTSDSLAHQNGVPEISSFAHSEMLEGHQNHSKAFLEFVNTLRSKETEVEAFREWLIANFRQSHEYLTRLNPDEHHEQLIKMMALYATDNTLAVQTAQRLFPGQSISAATSVCLQPRNEPDWLTEKIACDMLKIPIVQIAPFPNAGKWWYTKERQGVFSFKESEKTLSQQTPEATFKSLMKKPDDVILDEMKGNVPENIETLIALKTQRVTELVALLWGRDCANAQNSAFTRMRAERRS